MAGQKITEKELTANIKETASFLVTQPEGIGSTETESLRRAHISAVISALRSNGLLTDYSTTEETDAAIRDYIRNNVAR